MLESLTQAATSVAAIAALLFSVWSWKSGQDRIHEASSRQSMIALIEHLNSAEVERARLTVLDNSLVPPPVPQRAREDYLVILRSISRAGVVFTLLEKESAKYTEQYVSSTEWPSRREQKKASLINIARDVATSLDGYDYAQDNPPPADRVIARPPIPGRIWAEYSWLLFDRVAGLADVAGGFRRTMAHELQNVGTWDQFDLDARLAANASLWLLDIGPRIGPTGTEYPEGLGH